MYFKYGNDAGRCGKIRLFFHFADLAGVPGAVRAGSEQPLIAVQLTQRGMRSDASPEQRGSQQLKVLFAGIEEQSDCCRRAPSSRRAYLRWRSELWWAPAVRESGAYGNLSQDEVVDLGWLPLRW